MATDGVEIIDGDLAYTIYNSILDLYGSGVKEKIIRFKYFRV